MSAEVLQRDLWGGTEAPTAPFVASDTSKAAAADVRSKVERDRQTIEAFVRACGFRGATDMEIANGTGLGESTVRPRRGELVEAGRLFRDEKGEKRKSLWSDSMATVNYAPEFKPEGASA